MRTQELNLLVIFDAIMAESSITKAGERLNMSQPAVSNAVARMRHVWKDDLFIKNGRKILPTTYAQRLWEKTRSPLKDINNALEPTVFDAASSDRTFNIAAIDSVVGLVWPQLRSLIENEAPNISVHAYPYTISNGERVLNDAKVEILIAASNLMPPLITSKFLYEVEYLCVMKANHPLARKKLTLENYANADHLLVAPSGDIQGYSDQVLAERGLKRQIGLTVNGFSSVPNILIHSNLTCTLPSIFVEDSLLAGTLVAQKTPFEIPNTRISMYWHKRSENDIGITWLGEKIEKILKKRVAQHRSNLAALFS